MVTLKISRVVDSALRWQWLLLVTTIFVVWLNQRPSGPLIKRLKRPTDAWAFGSAVRALHIVLVASNLPKLGILKYEHYMRLSFVMLCIWSFHSGAAISFAQTDLYISGPDSGFPVAVMELCDAGGAAAFAGSISDSLQRNLQVSGLFKIVRKERHVEQGKSCRPVDQIAYSDWTVLGVEGLVRGTVRDIGFERKRLIVELFLVDVLQQRPVIGKRYEISHLEARQAAHKFSNEVINYFTGTPGVFGTQISYVEVVQGRRELFMVDLDGFNRRQLTRDASIVLSPSWSPNGEQILFTSYRSGASEIHVYNLRTDSLRQVTALRGVETGAKFSPDGRRILATATISGKSSIVLFNLRGRLLRRLSSSNADEISAAWSPDGRQAVFSSNQAGSFQIYVQPVDSGKAQRISNTRSAHCAQPAWSPSGDRIAFACRNNDGFQIFSTSPDGEQAAQLTFSGNNTHPSWSPDGRMLTFASTAADESRSKIMVLSLISGAQREVISNEALEFDPSWSPQKRN